jgi:hypothetical protein
MAMRQIFPARGATYAALALVLVLISIGAGDSKKKKKLPEPPPPKIDENVGSLARVQVGEVPVEGVGLVIGLNNTGSDPPPSAQRAKLLDEMRKAGVEHPEQWLARPSCSMVFIKAILPHGISTKDPIDVDIYLPPASGTTSLAGGRLLMTELQPIVATAQGPKEGRVLAIAGGPIMTGEPRDPGKVTVGSVLGGGRVKADIPYNLVIKDERRSARTTKLVEDTIKLRFHQNDGSDEKGFAAGKSDNLLVLKVPKVYHHNQVRYFQVIEHLSVVDNPGLRAQRMQAWGKELLDPKTAGKAALKLEGLGSNAIPILKTGIGSTDPQVRFFAAESLAYLGNVDGADVLSDTAIKKAEFRSYALKALAAMDQSAGVMRLRTLMAQSDVELRYGSFDALRSFDASDPFLGQVQVLESEPTDEEATDALALQTETGRRRRRVVREEPFRLYVVDCEGPPLVHISRNLRCEIVLFGKGMKLLTPIVLGAGGSVLLTASEGDNRVQISHITPAGLDEPDTRVNCSLEIVDVLRQAARLNATYPELVSILTGAFNQKNLPGPLVVDAIPMPSKAYSEAQLLGGSPKKDDAVKKTSGESEKKPRMLGRLFERFNR